MSSDRLSELLENINATLASHHKVSILFVCLGNICRSPAAEGVLKDLIEKKGYGSFIEVDSAGTYGGHAGDLPDKRMRVHAARRGLSLTHISRKFRPSDFDNFDIIVAMDDSNFDRLRDLAPTIEAEQKIVRMIDFVTIPTRYDCVPDPYYDGAEGFELVLDLLENGCHNLLESLHP